MRTTYFLFHLPLTSRNNLSQQTWIRDQMQWHLPSTHRKVVQFLRSHVDNEQIQCPGTKAKLNLDLLLWNPQDSERLPRHTLIFNMVCSHQKHLPTPCRWIRIASGQSLGRDLRILMVIGTWMHISPGFLPSTYTLFTVEWNLHNSRHSVSDSNVFSMPSSL